MSAFFGMLRTTYYSSATTTTPKNDIKAWGFFSPPIIIILFLIIPGSKSVQKLTVCKNQNSGDFVRAINTVQFESLIAERTYYYLQDRIKSILSTNTSESKKYLKNQMCLLENVELCCIGRLILHSNYMLQTQVISACQTLISRIHNSCWCSAVVYNMWFILLKDVQIMLNHSTDSLSSSYWKWEETQNTKKLTPESKN